MERAQGEGAVLLPVRRLCEFLLRSGDIDNRFGGADRALEGARIHRRLQKEAGGGYRPEVALRLTARRGGRAYDVQGRADGVVTDADGGVAIDEIKTTTRPLELIGENFDRAHWGQGVCYAYMLARQEALDRVKVRVRYVQADTLEILAFEHEFPFAELERIFFSLLDRYERWARLGEEWRAERDRSIAALPFPFGAYRTGQRELAVAVYRTAAAGGRLFCQAPTGVGKTVSTLFPAVKAMGAGKGEKIFYLTAKALTRRAAEQALETMRRAGLRLRSVTLTAKDKICPMDERDCNPEACPRAAGYYDRAGEALYAFLGSTDAYTREALESCADTHRLCPFELSLDVSEWCDAVIGDYNHLFDPVASLKRFFGEGGDYVFLIDEAHNLIDRARDMYSAELRRSALAPLRRLLRERGEKKLARALTRLDRELRELGKTCPGEGALELYRQEDEAPAREPELPASVLEQAVRFAASCDEWLSARTAARDVRAAVLEVYFSVSFFLRAAEICDAHYAVYAESSPRDTALRLCCLDPCALVDGCLSRGRAAIFFSATLSPPEYFASVLGGAQKAKKLAVPSPFDPERLCLLVADHVSTRYADRARSLGDVARLLRAFAEERRGNYLFFFPSHRYLRDVLAAFLELSPDAETIVQEAEGKETARAAFLARFDAPNPRTLCGFCVLGGVFGEGIDLEGDRLIGAAVVGVGLPQINPQQEILRRYYDRVLGPGAGFDFAYRFPGMNKVLQAAGRVIRGEGDRGAVLLIDSRFSSPACRALFPAHWKNPLPARSEDELRRRLGAFWSDGDGVGNSP